MCGHDAPGPACRAWGGPPDCKEEVAPGGLLQVAAPLHHIPGSEGDSRNLAPPPPPPGAQQIPPQMMANVARVATLVGMPPSHGLQN